MHSKNSTDPVFENAAFRTLWRVCVFQIHNTVGISEDVFRDRHERAYLVRVHRCASAVVELVLELHYLQRPQPSLPVLGGGRFLVRRGRQAPPSPHDLADVEQRSAVEENEQQWQRVHEHQLNRRPPQEKHGGLWHFQRLQERLRRDRKAAQPNIMHQICPLISQGSLWRFAEP